jgi:hypothetical protein
LRVGTSRGYPIAYLGSRPPHFAAEAQGRWQFATRFLSVKGRFAHAERDPQLF